MVDNQLDVNAQLRVGGLGDLEGDERTLSKEACEEITEIARADLRDRYTDLEGGDGIYVLCINAPNVAIVAERESDE